MSGTADRLTRLLTLVPYLLSHPDVALATVARDFGVSREQVRKDLELLWVCGLPGYGPGDLIDLSFGEDDTVRVTHDAGISRPLRLSVDEALALIVALRTLAEVPGLDPGGAVQRALAKLETAAGDAAAPSAQVAVTVEAERLALAELQRAVTERRAVRLTYYSAGRDEITDRVVDPMRLLLVAGRSYLEAWCRTAEGVRLFRTDRVDQLQVLDEPAQPPPQAVPTELAEGLYRPADAHQLLVLELQPAARWVPDSYPCERVVQRPDGGLTVTLRAADPGWARRLVLSLGPRATVVAPVELAEAVRAEARAALANYSAERTG